MAQILLNLALSCSIVILILTMLSLMLLNVPVRAASNCARVAVLASAVLIGARVGVGIFGVCARSILFNCNKNNNLYDRGSWSQILDSVSGSENVQSRTSFLIPVP